MSLWPTLSEYLFASISLIGSKKDKEKSGGCQERQLRGDPSQPAEPGPRKKCEHRSSYREYAAIVYLG